jgi:hypothetical protein
VTKQLVLFVINSFEILSLKIGHLLTLLLCIFCINYKAERRFIFKFSKSKSKLKNTPFLNSNYKERVLEFWKKVIFTKINSIRDLCKNTFLGITNLCFSYLKISFCTVSLTQGALLICAQG